MSQSTNLTPADNLLIPATDPQATVGLWFTVAEPREAMSPIGYMSPANQINAAAALAAQMTANAAVPTSMLNMAGGPPALDANNNFSNQSIGPNISAFPTVAALQIYPVIDLVDNQIANITNHTADGDNGGGPPRVWNSTSTATADGCLIINPAGNTGPGRWIPNFSGPVNVRWFGAVGNYNGSMGTDDTAAIQAAINWCKANAFWVKASGYTKNCWWPMYIPASNGTYLVTESLNATVGIGDNAYAHLAITGDGTNVSGITGKLLTANPILDLAGNCGVELRDFSILAGGGLETASILISSTAANNQGGGNTIVRNVNASAGLYIVGADLCWLENCNISSATNWGICAGGLNGAGILSGYQTLGSTNTTQIYLVNCNIASSCLTTGAAWYDEPDLLTIVGGYVTVTGASGTRPSIIRVSAGSGQIYAEILGMRTENESSQAGLAIFQSFNNGDGPGNGPITGKFVGNFETDILGAVFDMQAANGGLINATLFNPGLASAIFTVGSLVQSFNGETSAASTLCLGALASGSANIVWKGESNRTVQNTLTNNATVRGLSVADSNQNNYKTINDQWINPNAPSIPLYLGGNFAIQAGNLLAPYTGGSGLLLGFTYTIPAGVFVSPSSWSSQVGPVGKIDMTGVVTSAAAAGGVFQIQLIQGSKSYNFSGMGVAAYASPSMNMIKVTLTYNHYNVVTCEITIGGTIYVAEAIATSLSSSSAITLNILVNNTASSPYQVYTLCGGI